MSDVVALLLDESMSPERLGALLRGARKRRGLKRRHVAALARISTDQLRDYERGARTIPADVCARLAECYGEHLTAHVPLRVPPEVDEEWLVVSDHRLPRVHGTTDEIIREYAQIVHRLRGSRPGQVLPLRAADLAVLGAAFETDPTEIEHRIAEILGCTHEEAHRLHGEMLRRKVVLPVAGLAASVIALAGVNAAQASDAKPAPQTPSTQAIATVAPTTAHTLAPPTTPHTAAPHTTVAHVPAPPHVSVPPVTAPPPVTDPPVVTPPVIEPDDTPVSVLPGETPVSIIGTSITTTEPND
jgi:transcriptional regulator with XRE-family HTH domain